LIGQFLEILHGASGLFSWHREMGVEHLDISEESIRTVMGWADKGSERTETHPDRRAAPQKYGKKPPSPEIGGVQLLQPEIGIVHVPGSETRVSDDRSVAPQKFSRSALPTVEVPPLVDGATQSSEEPILCKGDPDAQLCFFSEALDYFSPAGELFLKILKAMNLDRESISLCTFAPLDYTQGLPSIRERVARIGEQAEEFISGSRRRTDGRYPRIICTFGDSALKILMGSRYLLTDARGRFHNYNGVELMPTYHPAQILADQNLKRVVWEDIKQIMATAGLTRG